MQTILNLGTGGSDLNGQNGSTTSADSNDAMFLDCPGDNGGNYVYLPGGADNFMTVPDEAALDITGDIDLRVYAALDDWTTSSAALISKWLSSDNNRGYSLHVTASGALVFYWSENGAVTLSETSTANLSVNDGDAKWVRVTLDVDDGAAGYQVAFYYSDDGNTWTQLGATITGAGTTSIYSNSKPVAVGAGQSNSANQSTGKFYRAQILDGIDGTTVLDVDCAQITAGAATSFTALTGQTVTINRSVSVSSAKSVAVISPTWLFAVDDYMTFPYTGRQMASATGDMTTFLFLRRWPYPVGNNPERMFNTLQNVIGSVWAGFNLGAANDTEDPITYVRDDTNTQVAASSGSNELHTDGTLDVYGAVLSRSSNTWKAYVNGAEVASVDASSIGAITPIYDLFVGRPAAGNVSYMEAEVFGGAVFDRALTSAEVSAVTTYYQNKVA